jgi:Carboxypeptidase regulatory-like domain/TonB dependent receptor
MRFRIKWIPALVTLAALVSIPESSLWGQSGLPTYITGIVTDTSGGVVRGANVTVTNDERATTFSVSTTDTGLYRTPTLLPGPYSVKVSAAGFKTTIRSGLSLQIGQGLQLDLRLEVGGVNQHVEVRGETPLLDTENGEAGQSVENATVEALPLYDRRVGVLIAFTPGADYAFADTGGFDTPNYQVSGSGEATYTIGDANVSNDRTGYNAMFLSPPIGAVEETRVVTSGYNAEYGGSSGSVVTMQLKSGTNQYHGELYFNFRNEAMDARDPFSATRARDRQYIPGGAVGGPIWKDRTFFFFATEIPRNTLPHFAQFSIPTPAMLSGDFSGLRNGQGQQIPIYDPATTRPDPNNPGNYIRDQFPGNIIPVDRIPSVAANIAKYYPLPNEAGTVTGANNYASNFSETISRWSYVGKVDHRLNGANTLSFQYLYDAINDQTGNVQGWPIASAGDPSTWIGFLTWWNTWFVTGSETHIFSPTLFNQAKFSWHGATWQNKSPGYNPSAQYPNALGLTNVYQQDGFPEVTFAGYVGLGAQYLQNLGQTPVHTYDWSDTVAKTMGSHTLKFGLDIIYGRVQSGFNLDGAGVYNFSPNETALPNIAATGNSVASFLLGQVDNGSLSQVIPKPQAATTYYGLFVQDNWRASAKLTLDYGLRWEADTSPGQSGNRGSGFNPTAINPVSGTPGIITFMGVDMPLKFHNTDLKRFQPRFGFAYKLYHSTVVRGSYGIFSAFNFAGANSQYYPSYGFNPVSYTWSTTNDGVTPAWNLADGLPAWTVAGPADRTPGFGAVPVGQSPILSPQFQAYNQPFGYAQHLNLSVQQELPGQVVVEIGGEGSLGRKLWEQFSWNQVPPNLALPGNAQVRRPYPQFGDITQLASMEGTTDFWGLTARIEKRYSNGLSIIGAYAWSKTLGVMNCDDSYNCRLSRGPTAGPRGDQASVPSPYQHFRLAFVYDLPFGERKKWVTSGVPARLLGNWKVSSSIQARSGYPFSLSDLTDSQNRFSTIGYRVNLVGVLHPSHQSLNEWFNQAAVAPPAFGQIGNLAPGVLTGPGLFDVDSSILKQMRLTEQVHMILRGEFFNVLNHPADGLPGTTYGAPDFGIISSGASSAQFGGSTSSRISQIGVQFIF